MSILKLLFDLCTFLSRVPKIFLNAYLESMILRAERCHKDDLQSFISSDEETETQEEKRFCPSCSLIASRPSTVCKFPDLQSVFFTLPPTVSPFHSHTHAFLGFPFFKTG